MRKKMKRVAALAAVMLVVFSLIAALPVGADEWILEDWIWPFGIPGWYWPVVNGSTEMGMEGFYKQEAGAYDDMIYQPKQYYTQSTEPSVSLPGSNTSGGGGGGVRGGSGTATAYTSGQTVQTSIVNQTWNATTNNYDYSLHIPTSIKNEITNNYYETYNIKNTYYNNTYNTYRFETTNNYNYYVTYSPTYVNITYLDSAKNQYVANSYFYQLPDGRNSWDLTADEVFGMYFIYNAANYDLVVEDPATLGLYHFDGNLKDEGAYKKDASYLSGASYNYVDHAGFESALYWNGESHALSLGTHSNVGTVEFMLYMTQPGTVPVNNLGFKLLKSSYSDRQYVLSVSSQAMSGNFVNMGDPNLVYWGQVSADTATSTKKYMYLCYYKSGYLLSMNGQGYFPLYEKIVVQNTCVFSSTPAPAPDTGYWNSVQQNVSIVSAEYVLAKPAAGGGMEDFAVGQWRNFAVSGGKQYIDGMEVSYPVGSSSYSGVAPSMPQYGNYTMIDEVRISSGTLYSGQYIPQSHPFDTNKVMVLPASVTNGNIAVKSNVPVGNMRVGGVRPTYPTVGDVYVAVEKEDDKHVVKALQQYQSGGWVAVDGAIGVNGEWVHLKDYDLKGYTVEPGDFPEPDDTPVLRKYTGSTITFEGPENAIQKIVIHGKTYEVGSGTKSPDNPYDIYGIENPVVTVNGTDYTMATNGELFDGDYRSSDGTEYHSKGVRVFDGSEAWDAVNTSKGGFYRYRVKDSDVIILHDLNSTGGMVTSHYSEISRNVGYSWQNDGICITNNCEFILHDSNMAQDIDVFLSWLSSQNVNGTPLKIVFPRKDPTTETHTPTVFTNEAGTITITGTGDMEVWALTNRDSSGSGGDNSGGDNSGGNSGGNNSGDGDGAGVWGKLLDALGTLFDFIVGLVAKLVDGIVGIVKKLVEAFESLSGLGGSFGQFLGAAFVFIPPEIIAVIVLGLSLAVVLMVINFFR